MGFPCDCAACTSERIQQADRQRRAIAELEKAIERGELDHLKPITHVEGGHS